MQSPKPKPTLLIAAVTVILFVVAAKTRHPYLIIAAFGMGAYTYILFRNNYRRHRRRHLREQRRSEAIDIETREVKESLKRDRDAGS